MIDDHPDPGPDPLAGWDPHPREQIDFWPLHDARQELLEEIVSQAGPGESPARSKVLLTVVGIAAALALVAGGAWAVTNDGSGNDKNDDQVVAATSDDPAPTDVATDPTTAPTTEATVEETAEPTKEPDQKGVRRKGVRITDVRTLRECLADIEKPGDGKGKLNRLPKVIKRGKHHWTLYVVRKSGQRYLAIGDDCKWVRVVPEKPRDEN